jgi:hypothetical protein
MNMIIAYCNCGYHLFRQTQSLSGYLSVKHSYRGLSEHRVSIELMSSHPPYSLAMNGVTFSDTSEKSDPHMGMGQNLLLSYPLVN